ncbi:hypothetical protein ACF1BU_32170 [Streptomyces sp. NPDC014724]
MTGTRHLWNSAASRRPPEVHAHRDSEAERLPGLLRRYDRAP